MFAALIWQGVEQNFWTLPPRVDAGNEVVQCAHKVALATMVDLFNKESRPRFPWSGPQLHDGGGECGRPYATPRPSR